MAKKPLTFYVHQLIINNKNDFDCSTFVDIKEEDTETFEMTLKDDKKEILSVKKMTKTLYEDRFVGIAFDEGEKYPYPTTVVDKNLDEKDNPRKADQIELDEQFFVLIDTQTKRIWTSTQKKKTAIIIWLKEKLDKEVVMKSIIKDGEFIQKIKSVKEISFSIVPNLFNSSKQETLSNHLVQDILGFGAEKARILLEYKNSKISDIIKGKLNEIIGKKNEFQDITVIGKSDENLESTFNLEEISSKIRISVATDETSKFLDSGEVFSTLIKQIKTL